MFAFDKTKKYVFIKFTYISINQSINAFISGIKAHMKQ